MKCKKCGAELIPGVSFCRECGAKVELQKLFCRDCGAKLEANAKFCSVCGAKVDFEDNSDSNPANDTYEGHHEVPKESRTTGGKVIEGEYKISASEKTAIKRSLFTPSQTSSDPSAFEKFIDKVKAAIIAFWSGIDTYEKAITVIMIAVILRLITALCGGKVFPIILCAAQVCGLIAAVLIHTEKIVTSKKWIKYVIPVLVIILLAGGVVSRSSSGIGSSSKNSVQPSTTDRSPATIREMLNANTPYDALACKGEKYQTVKSDFLSAGFGNITPKIIDDLDIADADKDGIIESVTINSISDFSANQEFPQNARVVIEYHSYKTICAPISSADAASMDAAEIKQQYLDAGFSNVNVGEVFDLDPAEASADFVSSIEIDGKSNFDNTEKFPINANVEIVTHRACEMYTLKVVVDFVPNWFFNTYNVDFDLANEKNTLKHGTDAEFTYRLKPGDYTLTFSDAEDSSIAGIAALSLTGDTEAAYKILCYSDKITVETLYVENKDAVGEGEAMVPLTADDCKYKDYKEVEEIFKNAGFSNITSKAVYDIVYGFTKEGSVKQVLINENSDFARGNIYKKDSPVTIMYHLLEEDDPDRPKEEIPNEVPTENVEETPHKITKSNSVSYSTNDKETVKNGDTGVYAYKVQGGVVYYIIDFDDGYVYRFTDNEEITCDKVKIESGNLNDVLIITYHDGDNVWSYGLHFNWKRQPDHLILQDENGSTWDYLTTDLNSALKIRDTKQIKEY